MLKAIASLLLLLPLMLASANFATAASPDSVSLDDPTEDGYIQWTSVTGYMRINNYDWIRVGQEQNGYDLYRRGYVEWDISSIPDSATITGVVFKYHGKAHDIDWHIHEMVGTRPSTSAHSSIYAEAGSGTIYVNPAGFPVEGTNKEIDLGASAVTDLQNQLEHNWFAIGFQSDFEEGAGFSDIYAEEYSGVSPAPTLYVTYTTLGWQTVETWTNDIKTPQWQEVETWTNSIDVGVPPAPPDWITIETWNNYAIVGAPSLVWQEVETWTNSIINIPPDYIRHETIVYLTADALVSQYNPDVNYGSTTYLETRVRGSVNNMRMRSYLKFNLSSIPGIVENANLYLYLYSKDYDMTSEVWSVDNDNWNEGAITWNTKPAFNQLLDRQHLDNIGWWAWDISDFARGEIDIDNIVTILLKIENAVEDSWYDGTHMFGSREYSDASYRPHLKIVYWAPPTLEWQEVETWTDNLEIPYRYGSGTADDPYIVENVEGLQGMIDDLTAHYALGNDIDASATSGWNDGAGFLPVGTTGNRFTGTFDGNGYKISNLYIDRPTTSYVGLFGYVGSGGVVENVGMENVYIRGAKWVGGLVGRTYSGTISNSYSTGTVIGNVNIPYGYGSGIGGLVGGLSFYDTLDNSYSTCAVSGYNYVGGLVGQNCDSVIYRSYATGAVSGSGTNAGGLVGSNIDGGIYNSYSTGSVSGSTNVGGFLGRNDFQLGVYNAVIDKSYSTGLVSGSTSVGGFVGLSDGTVSNSFWDNQTSGQTTSAGGTGKTTENMKNVRTFTDVAWSDGLEAPWDFVDDPYDDVAAFDIWDIDGVTNDGYPFLGPPVLGWKGVETWDDSLEVEELPPPPSDEMVWAMFAIRILFIFGPLGFVGWKFTQVRDPVTGLHTAVMVGVSFFAIVILWFVADAIELMLATV